MMLQLQFNIIVKEDRGKKQRETPTLRSVSYWATSDGYCGILLLLIT